jgi:peptidoglycan hydrolase-like protein with peptidoglycan-binding domain
MEEGIDRGCMMFGLSLAPPAINSCAHLTRLTIKENKMRKSLVAVLTLLLAFSITAMAQNANSKAANANSAATNANSTKKRGPVFRANKDQIKQAQAILKQRGFYTGEQTGKLDDDTRAGLKKYQEAEKIKVTGTLNKITLEKMNVTLTDKQKAM